MSTFSWRRLGATLCMSLVLGGMTLALLSQAGSVQASPKQKTILSVATVSFEWESGYSFQHGWLCYGTPLYLHCTQHWVWKHGRLISENPTWVPSEALPVPPKPRPVVKPPSPQHHTSSAPSVPVSQITSVWGVPAGDFCPTEARTIPANVHLWMVPSGCMGGVFTPNRWAYYQPATAFGWCNWWPEALMHVAYVTVLHAHSVPRAHAIVYWPPWLNGGVTGHYGYVEAVGHGWLLTSEMNMYWRGGGFGKVVFVYRPILSGMVFYYN